MFSLSSSLSLRGVSFYLKVESLSNNGWLAPWLTEETASEISLNIDRADFDLEVSISDLFF